MTIIVERDNVTATRITDAVGVSDVVESIDLVKAQLDELPHEYAVILGPSVPLSAAVALADTMRVTRPALGVILVRESIDTTVLAEALRSGMREVVPLGDLAGIGLAVQRTRTLHEALTPARSGEDAGAAGKVVTVFSAKGGVGKTTIATNLASALADRGAEVCIVDLDLSFGDVAIALQIFPTRTIADTVAMQGHLDSQGLEALLTSCRDGLYALAAPVQPDAKDSISASLVGEILRLLRERFAYIVVDTPPAFDDQVLQAFDESDLIVLVATPDIPALKNLKIACETFSLLNIPRERLLVALNRADSRVGVSPDEVAASLRMQITTSIPSSRDVPASVNRGELLFVSDPRHPVSQAIGGLAQDVTLAVDPPVRIPTDSFAIDGSTAGMPGHGRRRMSRMFARKDRA